MARDIRYLALDEVIEIHDRAVQEFGGSVELRDWGLLDSCVMTPQQVIFDTELYGSVEEKAAMLFYLLIQDHPFVDGNKRTAVLCLRRFLEVNGYRLTADMDEIYEFTMQVASGQSTKEEVADWVKQHTNTQESDA
jgi:death-on-curing protein